MSQPYDDRRFQLGILTWVLIGVAAYITLPWTALEYGLFDCTADEYIDALGWKSHLPSILVPLTLLLFIPLGWRNLSRTLQGQLLTGLSLCLTLLISIDFLQRGASMGAGTAIIFLVLVALFSYGIARLGFLQVI